MMILVIFSNVYLMHYWGLQDSIAISNLILARIPYLELLHGIQLQDVKNLGFPMMQMNMYLQVSRMHS
mgnify:CR=1 FL=1